MNTKRPVYDIIGMTDLSQISNQRNGNMLK